MMDPEEGIYIAPKRDTVWTDDLYSEPLTTKRYRRCVSCGELPIVTEERHFEQGSEYENVLTLDLHGGYAMFFDGQPHTVILCHGCAHEACDRLPWLAALLEPAKSHSHREAYAVENPDHYGWDYDMRAGTYYKKKALELFPKGKCNNCGHGREKHQRKGSTGSWECGESCDHLECWPGANLD